MFFGFTFLALFSINTWLSWSIASWTGMLAFLIFIPISFLLTIGGGVALGLIGMIFGKHSDKTRWKRFLGAFLQGWVGLTFFVWLLPWISFLILHLTNTFAPATLPRITITNGEKTVVFQSMMHIGSSSFYEDIKNDMERLKGEDFIFFYEGVQAGSAENTEQLNTLIGTNVSTEMYDVTAKVGDLITQDESYFLGILPSTNVDISIDDIVDLAQQDEISPASVESNEALEKILAQYPTWSPVQKQIAKTISRGIFNLLLRNYHHPELTEELKNVSPVFTIILDKRNEVLVQAINNSPSERIYIHYGALHYPGVLKLLQAGDNRWREISRTEYAVMR